MMKLYIYWKLTLWYVINNMYLGARYHINMFLILIMYQNEVQTPGAMTAWKNKNMATVLPLNKDLGIVFKFLDLEKNTPKKRNGQLQDPIY